ncbi:purple acid phosphatase [Striga asiatica]|uniref:Purple acid phosphatase n=1 Tax=Striga asiatica TaxID=4170 RepID=A0A5A7R9U2_STRAF|nr:purple acid phosphatase [Striga asiatica]
MDFPLSNLLIFLLLFSTRASPEYIRPSPRPLIFQQHDQPESDPQQVHVSLAGKDHIRVSWITTDKKVPSVVDYGTLPEKLDGSASGESTSYSYFLYRSGKIHHVKIGPLEPGTIYYYRCGGYGPELSFRTPPADFPVEFAVAGDLGQTEWTQSTLSHIGARDYDVLLLPGDLSYADTQQPLWDSFGRLVEPYASARPWMVTQGNHEIEIFPIIHPHGFKAYNARWLMPYHESGSTSNLYYSFDVARAHVIMLGSYADFDSDSDQYKWLQSDLASIDRAITPWVLVLVHVPWYNSNSAHKGEGEDMRKAMERMLYDARVDVVFAGHVHAYERFGFGNMIRVRKVCLRMSVIEFVSTLDQGVRQQGERMWSDACYHWGWRKPRRFESPSPSISVYKEASFGHGRLRVFNSTHAHWTWHRNEDDMNSIVADEIWLERLASSSVCKDASKPAKIPNDEL